MAKQMTKIELMKMVKDLKDEISKRDKMIIRQNQKIDRQGGKFRYRFHANEMTELYYTELLGRTTLIRETTFLDFNDDKDVIVYSQVRAFPDGNRVDIMKKLNKKTNTATLDAYFYDRVE